MITKIYKRDRKCVAFEDNRIKFAIVKAFRASKELENKIEQEADKITIVVLNELNELSDTIPTVELVQDIVEKVLMELGYYHTAKKYILYREKRAMRREKVIEQATVEEYRQLVKENEKYFENDPYRQFIYYRTYSKWLDQQKRREVWSETVDRYLSFMKEKVGSALSEDEYNEIRQTILNQEVVGSMRLMQFAGDAARRCNVCAYNCSYTHITSLRDFAEIIYLSMSGTGVGVSTEQLYVNQLPVISAQKEPKVIHKCVVEDSKEGWANGFLFCLERWYAGEDVEIDYSLLRPAGARLKTMGGRSSGPDPLRDLIEFTRAIILKSGGKKLSTLNVHDIVCKIGQIVVSGGLRRSSLISLSDLNDEKLRDCKKGAFWEKNGQRSMANNSAVYLNKPSMIEFMKEWVALVEAGTGERGIFNRGELSKQLPKRRVELLGDKIQHMGTNPCVTKDTWVQTIEGPRQVKDLIGKEIDLIVNGKQQKMQSQGFFYTGDKQVYELETNMGYKVKLTEDHPVLINSNRKINWVKLKDVKIGDNILLSNHRANNSWSGEGTFDEGWLLGEIMGDGGILITAETKNNMAYVRFWGDTAESLSNFALELVKKYCNHRSNLLAAYNVSNNTYQVLCVGLYKLCEKYGLNDKKEITSTLEQTSSEFQRGFIRGFFDADGTVTGNKKGGYSIRLAQSNIPRLEAVQRMLSRLGIISNLYKNRRKAGMRLLPDGNGGKKYYYCEADHELLISKDNMKLYDELVGFYEPAKSEKLKSILNLPRYSRLSSVSLSSSSPVPLITDETIRKEAVTYLSRYGENFVDKIISISQLATEDVYDVTVENVHEFCGNGLRLHNCSEILLQPHGFCNLSEVICRVNDTKETLARKVKIATILGTYQSMLTDFKYLSPIWKENQETERLLGVSLTGQWDSPIVRDPEVLQFLKEIAIETNRSYAALFGINASSCITTCKPSGTTSQLTNSASGIHTRFSPYYIRRVRISATDPLFHLMRDEGIPYFPENGQSQENATTFVFEFPIKSPDNAICADQVSACNQLEYWKRVKTNYTEHNPSCTIYVKENEWLSVGDWIYSNWQYIGGLSFLPYSDHIYPLAPYEKITKERYEALVAKMPTIHFDKLLYYERDDQTEQRHQVACQGGVCEL